MRAIVLEKFGGLDSLVYKDIPEPEPKAGHVVIETRRLGSTTPRCTCGGASGPKRHRSAASNVWVSSNPVPAANFRWVPRWRP
jgi:hypothetical protein